jgi:hypothetical protein
MSKSMDVMSVVAPKAPKGSYGSEVSVGGKAKGRGMADIKPINPKRYESAARKADKRK